jgi:PAT family beta-lactamase induction signal transducer AmpG
VPHLTYLYLSQARPESLAVVALAVTVEKFGYGFGSVGHMLYMMQQMAPAPTRPRTTRSRPVSWASA